MVRGEGVRQAQHWLVDLDKDWRLRNRRSGTNSGFHGWHNVENFSICAPDRAQFNVAVASWWSDWEPPRFGFRRRRYAHTCRVLRSSYPWTIKLT